MKVMRTLESQETRAFDVPKKAYACDLGLACGHKLSTHQIAIDVASSAKTGFPVTVPFLVDLKVKVNICFIALLPPEISDNKHVVFGKVLEGMKVMRTLESQETRAFDVPKKAYACDLGLACGHKLRNLIRKDPQERNNIEFKMPYFLASSFRSLASECK
ncbi:hypothetical protein Bca52824_023678 [Brassica carinata]|uniref:PPIase cyclophilin-type domain-containing protein n=1 Tax=Brassica carinata TaxID=52824 RepID=A0A8X7VIW9_BRACI|nr:hypothetical protein Bca52824_023678 [Brassica carinata]